MLSFPPSPSVRIFVGRQPVDSGEDDDGVPYWDKVPEYIKERNFIFMLPNSGGKYIAIPMPYGYNVFHVAGRKASSVVFGGESVWTAAGDMTAAFLGSFNPIGSESSFAQVAAPTLLDPLIQIESNKTFSGMPIRPDPNPFAPEPPDAQTYYPTVAPPYKWTTDLLTAITGGDEFEAGLIDVSPETLEHWGESFGGGVYKLIQRLWTVGDWAQSGLSGEPYHLPYHKRPFIRRVMGEVPQHVTSNSFYDSLDDIERHKTKLKTHFA